MRLGRGAGLQLNVKWPEELIELRIVLLQFCRGTTLSADKVLCASAPALGHGVDIKFVKSQDKIYCWGGAYQY